MRRLRVPIGIVLLLTLAACARSGQSPDPGAAPGGQEEAFRQRATEVAQAWQAAAGPDWRTGYVPLQDATVLPPEVRFTDDTKQAFLAGWYREQVKLPTAVPAQGSIRFPDGTLTVSLVSAADAYRQLDLGDPPPCPGRPAEPPAPTATGPDGSVSGPANTACTPLTVSAAELGTVRLRTSRGTATVPAWLFTVDELKAKVARVAVAPAAVGSVPEPPPPANGAVDGLVAAQDLTGVDGAKLTYRLGVGACDTSINPLVREQDDLILVGGSVVRSTGVCTEQLLLEPVTVTLDAPVGNRTVLDALNGRPLLLTTVG